MEMLMAIESATNQMFEEMVTTQASALAGFLQLSLEGVLGAVTGFGKIAVGTVLHGVGVAVAELVFHGIVAGLVALVGLERTFSAVGIVVKMIAYTLGHSPPFDIDAPT